MPRMEINMALLDKMLTQILTETLATAKTQSLRGLILAVAFLGSATASSGEETRAPGSSQPPDTTQYQRPAVPMDRNVARRIRRPVRARLHGSNPNLLKLIDVNASAPGSDSVSRTEPSIAVNPETPNVIVLHGGFAGG